MTDATPDDAVPPESMESNAIVPQAVGHSGSPLPEGYAEWLADVKKRVRATQFRAARAANTEILRLYWSIGHDILERQHDLGWGSKVVEQVSRDLRREFPSQSGWSRTNLHYMRRAAEAWPREDEFVPQAVGQMPWGHVRVLLDQLSTRQERDWYAAKAAADGWSRNVLEHFIKVDLRHQLGSAPANFDHIRGHRRRPVAGSCTACTHDRAAAVHREERGDSSVLPCQHHGTDRRGGLRGPARRRPRGSAPHRGSSSSHRGGTDGLARTECLFRHRFTGSLSSSTSVNGWERRGKAAIAWSRDPR